MPVWLDPSGVRGGSLDLLKPVVVGQTAAQAAVGAGARKDVPGVPLDQSAAQRVLSATVRATAQAAGFDPTVLLSQLPKVLARRRIV